MRIPIACFLFIFSAVFASTRNEDLAAILEKTYLSPQCAPILNMLAMEAITVSQKKIDTEVLVEQFCKCFREERNLDKFFASYKDVFSDKEVRELRELYESSIWQKFCQEIGAIYPSQMQCMKDAFKELAANFAIDETVAVVANGEVLHLTQENFQEVAESELPVIIDVKASWCHSCQMMEPIMEQLSEKYKGRVLFAQIDIDEESKLVEPYKVTLLPTILFIKPGQKKPAMKSVGFMSKKDFDAKIGAFLGDMPLAMQESDSQQD